VEMRALRKETAKEAEEKEEPAAAS
jgi:hypothetical protein